MHFSPFNSIGCNINKDLLALGKVANALADKTHVPYRESKLTRILEGEYHANMTHKHDCHANIQHSASFPWKYLSVLISICNKFHKPTQALKLEKGFMCMYNIW